MQLPRRTPEFSNAASHLEEVLEPFAAAAWRRAEDQEWDETVALGEGRAMHSFPGEHGALVVDMAQQFWGLLVAPNEPGRPWIVYSVNTLQEGSGKANYSIVKFRIEGDARIGSLKLPELRNLLAYSDQQQAMPEGVAEVGVADVGYVDNVALSGGSHYAGFYEIAEQPYEVLIATLQDPQAPAGDVMKAANALAASYHSADQTVVARRQATMALIDEIVQHIGEIPLGPPAVIS